jgi:hypothetical protein
LTNGDYKELRNFAEQRHQWKGVKTNTNKKRAQHRI